MVVLVAVGKSMRRNCFCCFYFGIPKLISTYITVSYSDRVCEKQALFAIVWGIRLLIGSFVIIIFGMIFFRLKPFLLLAGLILPFLWADFLCMPFFFNSLNESTVLFCLI